MGRLRDAIESGSCVQLVIMGRPVSWKNSARIIRGRIPIKNPAQKRWAKSAVAQLSEQWREDPLPKSLKLNASIVSFLPTRGIVDSDNLYGGPHDVMESAGVLENDSSIQTHDGSDRLYNKQAPRVEITLSKYNPDPSRRARVVIEEPGLNHEETKGLGS